MNILLIQHINDLINQYGLEEVVHVVSFAKSYPVSSVKKAVSVPVYDNTGRFSYWSTQEISKSDYDRIMVELKAGNKILSIKMFREITACSLRPAKDTIEGPSFLNTYGNRKY